MNNKTINDLFNLKNLLSTFWWLSSEVFCSIKYVGQHH